jgi:HipA-like C-terminal domain
MDPRRRFCHKKCVLCNPQKSAVVLFGPSGLVASLWRIGVPGAHGSVRILTPRHAPSPDLSAHLTFALKYEGLDLAVLRRLFEAVGSGEIESGHAKNFSIFLLPGGRFRLTPLYDVMSAQPNVDAGEIRHNAMKLAMAVGDSRHYVIDSIVPRHFLSDGCRRRRIRVSRSRQSWTRLKTTPIARWTPQ